MTISRRRILRLSGAAALLGAAGVGAAGALPRTPSQTSGPFYPADKPLDRDADLTRVRGRGERASGQVVHVMGRVLDVDGRPVKGARIEIWQANTHGRYTHPNDANTAPLDPGFEGYADLLTDEDGRYRFKTIKPAAYPINPMNPERVRPPHIHFDVSGRDARLVTQMYFPGEPANAGDLIFGGLGADEQRAVTASVSPPGAGLEPDSLLVRWDIVLVGG